MKKKRYSSDQTNGEWKHIKGLLPKAKTGGRHRTTNLREVVNAIFYLIRGGISWQNLPKDFPPYKTVYDYFRKWRLQGVWKAIHDRLRDKVRQLAGRKPQPTAGILDSQSVKAASIRGIGRGYDAGKNVTGRKRHLLVDTLGLVLLVVVHSASIQDRDGARLVLQKLAHQFTRLVLIWADGGYAGQLVSWVQQIRAYRRVRLEIVKRSDQQKGFVVLPKRWIVERTFGWLGRYRRLARDYEHTTLSSQTMTYIASVRRMLKLVAT